MIIRQETPQDYAQLYDLVKTAFQTAAVSSGDEQNYLDGLRKSNRYRSSKRLNGRSISRSALPAQVLRENAHYVLSRHCVRFSQTVQRKSIEKINKQKRPPTAQSQ